MPHHLERRQQRPVDVVPTTSPSARRWRHLLVDRFELAAILALALVITLWAVPSRGTAGLTAALDVGPFSLALGYFCLLAGRLVVGALRLPADRFAEIPTFVLIGFLTLNVLLLTAALVLPLPLPVDAVLIALGVVVWAVRSDPPSRPTRPSAAGLVCLIITLAAATLWSLDSIEPTYVNHGYVFFRPWADSFNHACFTRIFRDVHGIGSLEHFSLAGERAPFYHYASFLIPALLAATTHTSCYLAFATFQVPFGMTLLGLAAFMLARWWWTPGAGLAAVVGVLLIPDASRYGIANPYLGYYWLSEIGPTIVYGVAMAAVAWVLVLEGCRAGRPGVVLAGFVAAGLTVAFKAHLFAANAFLLWVYPAFFLRDYSRRTRLAWLAFSVATFVVAVRLSWEFAGVPLVKLDGSAMRSYLTALDINLNDPHWKAIFAVEPAASGSRVLGLGITHLMLGTFGAFALLFPLLAILLMLSGPRTERRSRVELALFPVFVTLNYLVMALGLALDTRTHHMPDELLHRPLVWAYFAVAAWTSACLYASVLQPLIGRFRLVQMMVPVVLVGLLAVPFFFGQGVQVGPNWGRDFTGMSTPVGLVRCAEFLREHSDRGEIVQNSEDDEWMFLSSLAERPVYVANTWKTGTQTNKQILRRLDELARFRTLTDPVKIAEFAAQRRIAWYVLDPTTKINWPRSVLARPVFESDGFRVYRFTPAG